jgi:hypothetical protein
MALRTINSIRTGIITTADASDVEEVKAENATPSPKKSATKTPRSGKIGRPKAEEVEGPMAEDEWESLKATKKEEVLALPVQKHGNPHEVFDCEYQIAGGCRTGQFDLNDSRTCVSDYFGRNKAATAKIKRPIRWCRKHYQRASFQKDTWQLNKMVLILEQLDRIEEDDAGTTYTIGIKRSELQRLSDYNNSGKKNPVDLQDLQPGEAPYPILQHIFDNYKGNNRTIDECKSLVNWVRGEREAGRVQHIPQFEMVPEWPTEDEDEEMLDANHSEDEKDSSPSPSRKGRGFPRTPINRNPKRKSSTKTATPTKGRVSRISDTGSIKKP